MLFALQQGIASGFLFNNGLESESKIDRVMAKTSVFYVLWLIIKLADKHLSD